MTFIPSVIPFAGAAILIFIAVTHLVRGKRRTEESLFSLTLLILAAIETNLGLLFLSRSPEEAGLQFRLIAVFSMVIPAFALPFALSIKNRRSVEGERRFLSYAILFATAAGAVALLVPVRVLIRAVHFTEEGNFWGISLSPGGKVLVGYVLITNIFALSMMENIYRSVTVPGKVILKYPFLGILFASIINILVLSRALALSLIDINALAVEASGLVILAVSFLFATARYGVFEVQLNVGRDIATSVVTIVISALYLLALAIITIFARALNIPFDRLTGTVLGLFAVFLLLSVLISGKARRRLRRFINENFYPTSYNYRREWRRYSELMASSGTIGDLITNVISAICDTMLAKKGLIWVAVAGGKSAFYGFENGALSPEDIEKINELYDGGVAKLVKKDELVGRTVETAEERTDTGKGIGLGWIRAIAFIGRADQRQGFIALGEKHMDSRYTEEDIDFLTTIADEISLSLENIMLEERIIESKQLESFNRFTSFIIHDLKNTVGMLSLLLDNASENLSDPDFQRDAMSTIQRSIEKMKNLIESLRSHTSPPVMKKSGTDLCELIRECIESLKEPAAAKRVKINLDCPDTIKINADHNGLKRVLENIIMNAIEASPEESDIGIVSQKLNGHVRISITDNGGGFDEEYFSNHLFKPFHSTKKNGLGIGLFICKSIVENHGGKLAVESKKGEGSTVVIELPVD